VADQGRFRDPAESSRRTRRTRRSSGRVTAASPARPKAALVIMGIFIVFLMAGTLVLMGL
jgi:hypothetical protein